MDDVWPMRVMLVFGVTNCKPCCLRDLLPAWMVTSQTCATIIRRQYN